MYSDKTQTVQWLTVAAIPQQSALTYYITTHEERRPADLRSENVLT